jgi:hypothetical protein
MKTDSKYKYANIRYSDEDELSTTPLLLPEWYSSHHTIASHTFIIDGEEYHVDLMRSGTFRASWIPSRKDMPKEVDGIDYNYNGHGNATRFLHACGVFNDRQLEQVYKNNTEGSDKPVCGWCISMNPWFAVRIASHGVGWPDDFEILHDIPIQSKWEEILEEAYEYIVRDEFVRGLDKEE